jgi:hypothetical protein
MSVNDVRLKVMDVLVNGEDSPHELHRSVCLVEREMSDTEAAQQLFVTAASRGDDDYMPLFGLSDSEIYRRINYAVANVRHLAQYVQNPHLQPLYFQFSNS